MAITVTPNLTLIDACDATTDWAGGTALLLDTINEHHNTGCLSDWIDATTSNVIKHTLSGSTDMSGNHLYAWMFCNGLIDTKANGGFRLYAETDASNYATWYVGGSDTHGGGWQLMVCDLDSTPTSEVGTFDSSDVTKIGVQFKTLSAAPSIGQNKFNNCFWDVIRYGTGLTITSGATDAIDLEDIYAVDNTKTNRYGVVTKSFGAYVVQGKLTFGDASGTGSVDFTDTNQVILFPDNSLVSDSFYGINVVGNATGTTNFTLGASSGGSGISGCTLKAVGSKTFSIDVSDSDNDTIGLYGSTFANAGTITLPTTATGKEVLNCNMTTTDGVVISTCVVANCNFISADDEAVIMSSTSHNLSDSNFIANPNAIRITTAGTYEFDNLQFTGNTNDIDNTSGGAVVVNCVNNSNPSTETGDTTINNAVTLTVQGVKTGTEPTNYVRCHIEKVSDQTVLMNEEAQTSYGSEGYYKATESYNYTADVDVIIRARYKGYLPFETTGTITSAGLTVTAVWIPDPNYI